MISLLKVIVPCIFGSVGSIWGPLWATHDSNQEDLDMKLPRSRFSQVALYRQGQLWLLLHGLQHPQLTQEP